MVFLVRNQNKHDLDLVGLTFKLLLYAAHEVLGLILGCVPWDLDWNRASI